MASREHSADMLVQFGRNIRRLREMRGLSQERLAEMVGYKSRTSINKIEMGKTDIGQKNIVKIANALGVTSADILPGTNVLPFDLYSRIESICKESQVSLEDLCKESGVSKTAIEDLQKGRINSLSSVEIQLIAMRLGVPAAFLFGEQPFRYWEEMLADIDSFLAHVPVDPELLKQLWRIDTEHTDRVRLEDVLHFLDSNFSSVTPIGDTWIIEHWDNTTNNREAAAEAADLSEVKANFIESVKAMTDEQVILLQAVVDQVLRENGLR